MSRSPVPPSRRSSEEAAESAARWAGERPLRLLVGPYVHAEHCAYMEGAFDDYETITFGPWEGSDLRVPGIVHLDQVLAALPEGFRPDLMLLWRPEYTTMPEGLEDAPFPVVMLMSDWYVAFTDCVEAARFVNGVVTGTRGERVFRAAGFDHVRAMPMLGYQAGFDGRFRSEKRDIDVFCAGNPNWTVHREREGVIAALMDLPRSVNFVHSPFVDRETYNHLLGRAKIFVNQTVIGEINMKCYEAPASGACLFVEEDNLDICDYLVPGESVVLFRREDLRAKVMYYLDHEEERAAIARAGREAMIGRSYRAQMRDIVESLRADGPEALLRCGREIARANAQDRSTHFVAYAMRHPAKQIRSVLRRIDALPEVPQARKGLLQGLMHYTARVATDTARHPALPEAWPLERIVRHLRQWWQAHPEDLPTNLAWAQIARAECSESEWRSAFSRVIDQLESGCRVPLGGSHVYTLPRQRRFVFERAAWEEVERGVAPDARLRLILLDFVYFLLGGTLAEAGYAEEALAAFERAIAACPEGDQTRPWWIELLIRLERWPQAAAVAREHLVHRPLDQKVRMQRLQALHRAGARAELIDELDRAERVAAVFQDTATAERLRSLRKVLAGGTRADASGAP